MNMSHWFEPNVHPLLVHFALALIVTSALCFVIAAWRVAHLHWSSSPLTGEHSH